MDELDETLAFALERAKVTRCIMASLAEQPVPWVCPGFSSADYSAQIQLVDALDTEAYRQKARLNRVAGEWDHAIGLLHADLSMGQQMARLKFKGDAARARLFDGLRLNNTGRESRHRQALDFESSWDKADATWTFKEGLTLEIFREQRRILRDFEEDYYTALKDELFARASLRTQAAALNESSMDWYEAATITFAADTVPGALVRTIPTTYDPNRPPGPLVFTRHTSDSAGHGELSWRAPRGRRYTIWTQRPGASEWEPLLTEIEENSWSAEDLSPGLWRFKGRAENNFGEGTESEVVEVAVAAMAAA